MFDLPPQDAHQVGPSPGPGQTPPAIVRQIDFELESFPHRLRKEIEDQRLHAMGFLEALREYYMPQQVDPQTGRQLLGVLPVPLLGVLPLPREAVQAANPEPAVAQPPVVPAPVAEGPQPLPGNMNPSFYDGGLIGDNGNIYAGNETFASIPPSLPVWGRSDRKELLIYVNGISTPPYMAQYHMRNIATWTGQPVIGVYNATDGDVQDVLQGMADKANVGKNPAVETLTREIQRALIQNEKLHLIGESQGALIISRSIGHARAALTRAGWGSTEIEVRLANITVETFGGSAWCYPDGPRYVHYINEHDPVPFHFGLTAYGLSTEEQNAIEAEIKQPDWIRRIGLAIDLLDVRYLSKLHPGRDARIVRFRHATDRDTDWLDTHMVETYLQYRKPVEVALQQEPAKPAKFEIWGAIRTCAKWLAFAGILYWAVRGIRSLKRAVQRMFAGKKPEAGGNPQSSGPGETQPENQPNNTEE